MYNCEDKRYVYEHGDCIEESRIIDIETEESFFHDDLISITSEMNALYECFTHEYKEVEELNKQINALCSYIYKIEGYVEANSDDMIELRKDYCVNTILGD